MERLSEIQLQNFLYQDENTSLDFKSEQYKFIGGNDESKSELLKDILAFANSWRDSEAYIVIGIEDLKGEKNKVIGCENPFDDAQLQQLVNSKTNKNINLAYEVYELEGKKIGIIRIAKQERPIYSKTDFGKVKKQVIYYRLGSSTKIANLDDIYKMGKDDHINNQPIPILDLQFVNHNNYEVLGKDIWAKNVSYFQPQHPLLNAYRLQSELLGGLKRYVDYYVNKDYWRQLEEYHRLRHLLIPLQFAITNTSDYLANFYQVDIDKVENFIDTLSQEKDKQELTSAYTKLSETIFSKVWDNPEDDDYDNL